MHSNIRFVFFGVALGLAQAACQDHQKSESLVPLPPLTPSLLPSVTPISSRTQASLAQLEQIENKVSYKRGKELLWQDAMLNLPLYRYDWVQTHDGAHAEIGFINGSRISLREKTLVIINPDSKRQKTTQDRAVIRGGAIRGETQRELWILTSAALVKVKADKKNESAVANLVLEEGKHLEVKLERGSGMLIQGSGHGNVSGTAPETASGKIIQLAVNHPVVIKAPKVDSNFGEDGSKVQWFEPEAAPNAQLVLSEPKDHQTVDDSAVFFKGQVTPPGGTVLINGKVISLKEDLSFEVEVPLVDGPNSLVIQLIRGDGSSAFLRRTVIRGH